MNALLCPEIAAAFAGRAVRTLSLHRPFLEPLRLDSYWLLLLPPLVIAVAVAYKTIKIQNLSDLPRESAYMAAQIIAFMILAATMMWFLTELV